jgi:hypothetical protein
VNVREYVGSGVRRWGSVAASVVTTFHIGDRSRMRLSNRGGHEIHATAHYELSRIRNLVCAVSPNSA